MMLSEEEQLDITIFNVNNQKRPVKFEQKSLLETNIYWMKALRQSTALRNNVPVFYHTIPPSKIILHIRRPNIDNPSTEPVLTDIINFESIIPKREYCEGKKALFDVGGVLVNQGQSKTIDYDLGFSVTISKNDTNDSSSFSSSDDSDSDDHFKAQKNKRLTKYDRKQDSYDYNKRKCHHRENESSKRYSSRGPAYDKPYFANRKREEERLHRSYESRDHKRLKRLNDSYDERRSRKRYH